MIVKLLQKQIEERIKYTKIDYLGYLKNAWGCSSLLVICNDIAWSSPSQEEDGWEALKRFQGIAGIVFPTTKMENLDLMELIAEIAVPIVVELDTETLTGQLGVKLQWEFNQQIDELGEFNLTTQLLGKLRGVLYKRL